MGVGEAIVLGLVQGLTEFLPISSTAHLRIVPALLGWADPGAAFSAVIQLGTVVAVLVYFARDLVRLSIALAKDVAALTAIALRVVFGAHLFPTAGKPFETTDARLAWFLGIGTIPIGVCGLLFKKRIETLFCQFFILRVALALDIF